MPPTSEEALLLAASFARLVALLAAPDQVEEAFGCFAAEAPLPYQFGIRLAGELAAADFALARQAAGAWEQSTEAGARLPAFGEPALTRLQADGPRRVGWFALEELTQGHALHAAVGFVPTPQGWRVGWLTLAAEELEWSYALGLAQTVADAAFADQVAFVVPRSWLDVAYHRLHGLARPPLLALEDARFACHGSATCCKLGFHTTLPAYSQAVLDAMPWEQVQPALAGTKLASLPDGRLLLKPTGEACRFLDEASRCVLHKALGRNPFSVCSVFPMLFAMTPDGVAVTTSGACPSARQALGPPLLARADDLHERLAIFRPGGMAMPTSFRLAPGEEVSWAGFKAVEERLLAHLAEPSRPLLARLARCEAELSRGAPALAEVPAREKLGLVARLTGLSPGRVPPDGRPRPATAAFDQQAAGFLRNLLFSKRYAFPHDLTTAHHLNLVFYWLLRLLLHDAPEGQLTPDTWLKVSARHLHQVWDVAEVAGVEAWEQVQAPGFGAWLLAIEPGA